MHFAHLVSVVLLTVAQPAHDDLVSHGPSWVTHGRIRLRGQALHVGPAPAANLLN
jgi:hypothetical protein